MLAAAAAGAATRAATDEATDGAMQKRFISLSLRAFCSLFMHDRFAIHSRVGRPILFNELRQACVDKPAGRERILLLVRLNLTLPFCWGNKCLSDQGSHQARVPTQQESGDLPRLGKITGKASGQDQPQIDDQSAGVGNI